MGSAFSRALRLDPRRYRRGFFIERNQRIDVTSLCLAGWSHIGKLPNEAALHLGIILWI